MRHRSLILALIVAVVPVAACAQAPVPPDYTRSPVFYAQYGERYSDPRNIELLREKKVAVSEHDVVDLRDFNWAGGVNQDFSWWVKFEELRFLLPVIASDAPGDRQLARDWFMQWHTANRMSPTRNKAAWWALTAARRAMVLVYYLAREEARADTDGTLAGLLRDSIAEHQRYLAQEGAFEARNNHGLREALALFETTRVHPDAALRALALERLLAVARVSVSPLGSHLEHAPLYHYVFLRWLDEGVTYLRTVPGVAPAPLAELGEVLDHMLSSCYFFQDHAGVVPPIGDSDATAVDARYRDDEWPGHALHYDAPAGYAIYKGNGGDDPRYLIFTNQNREPLSKSHYHDDVLALFVSYGGETILGDQGRYRYRWDAIRRYLVSPPAHNMVFPFDIVRSGRQKYHVTLADSVWQRSSGDTVCLGGRITYGDELVTREVLIPDGGSTVVVRDALYSSATDTAAALAMTWNIGPDVTGLTPVRTDAANTFAWRLDTRRGRVFDLTVVVTGSNDGPLPAPEDITGSVEPRLGWYAPRFRTLEPSRVLLFKLTPSPDLVVTTRLSARP